MTPPRSSNPPATRRSVRTGIGASGAMWPIRFYVILNALYLFVGAVYPARGVSQHRGAVFAADVTYVCLCALVAAITARVREVKRLVHSSRPGRCLTETELVRLIYIANGLSFLGIFLLYFDRAHVQGIDYSRGLSMARYQWTAAGAARGTVSSIYSVLGNLLAPCSLVAVALTHLHLEALGRHRALILAVVGVGAVMGNSALMGGRTPIVLAVAGALAIGCIRRSRGSPFFPKMVAKRALVLSGLFICGFLLYSAYVFKGRVEANQTNAYVYLGTMITHLGGELDPGSAKWVESPAVAYALAVGAYFVHSDWTFEDIMFEDQRPGTITFKAARDMLARIGLRKPDQAEDLWLYSGRFISLPGSLWYDFGAGVFVLAAAFNGLLFGIAVAVARDATGGVVWFTATFGILLITMLSPLIPAYEISVYPFLLFDCFLLRGSCGILGQRLSWLGTLRRERRRLVAVRPTA